MMGIDTDTVNAWIQLGLRNDFQTKTRDLIV